MYHMVPPFVTLLFLQQCFIDIYNIMIIPSTQFWQPAQHAGISVNRINYNNWRKKNREFLCHYGYVRLIQSFNPTIDTRHHWNWYLPFQVRFSFSKRLPTVMVLPCVGVVDKTCYFVPSAGHSIKWCMWYWDTWAVEQFSLCDLIIHQFPSSKTDYNEYLSLVVWLQLSSSSTVNVLKVYYHHEH